MSGEERARDERLDERDKTAPSSEGSKGSGEAIHNRIAVLRVDRGVSRREFAEALGVHYQTVGYLERGEYSPSLHLALRIAAYFDVPVEFVFSLEPFQSLRPDGAAEAQSTA